MSQTGQGHHIHDLLQSAQQRMSAGRFDEAAALLEQALVLAPENPEALFRLGQCCHMRRDNAGARALFERAEMLAPKNALIPLHLALVLRAAADHAGTERAIARALKADPYCYPALLLRGELLEARGRTKAAARVYRDALRAAPPGGSSSPELSRQLGHARAVVNAHAAALDAHLGARLDNILQQADAGERERFEECKESMLGRTQVYVSQPTMLHFPRLPAIPFFDNRDFAFLAQLESQTDIIRDELIGLLERERPGFRPYVRHPDGAPLNQWAELNFSPDWSAYFLWEDGVRLDAHCRECPRTADIMESLPLAQVPGYAPAVFFSLLRPKAHIPPHTGVTNTRLIVHLPLIAPAGSGFRVGNNRRDFVAGKAWVFDDTIEHEAWNDSESLRALLIFDVWNPLLSATERKLVCALLDEVRRYYDEPDRET